MPIRRRVAAAVSPPIPAPTIATESFRFVMYISAQGTVRCFQTHTEHIDSSSVPRLSGICAVGQRLSRVSHRDHDLADLCIAQHVCLCVGNPLERERTVEYGFECSCGKSTQQVGSEPLTTD